MYFQTREPFLVISAFGLFSFANSLFLYPTLYNLYYKGQVIYKFEHADGAGRATDLVIQPAVRLFFLGFITIVSSSAVLYLLVNIYHLEVFFAFKTLLTQKVLYFALWLMQRTAWPKCSASDAWDSHLKCIVYCGEPPHVQLYQSNVIFSLVAVGGYQAVEFGTVLFSDSSKHCTQSDLGCHSCLVLSHI